MVDFDRTEFRRIRADFIGLGKVTVSLRCIDQTSFVGQIIIIIIIYAQEELYLTFRAGYGKVTTELPYRPKIVLF